MSGQDEKPFAIPKELVWQAWKQVKANGGAAGADGVTVEAFERDLKDNLCKVWNRMSSGTYFPPPVRAVEIPKSAGGTRMPGVPCAGDRVAQTVAALALEPGTEAVFHDDSYGCRPRKGALDAVAVCRQRCWAKNWVIDTPLTTNDHGSSGPDTTGYDLNPRLASVMKQGVDAPGAEGGARDTTPAVAARCQITNIKFSAKDPVTSRSCDLSP